MSTDPARQVLLVVTYEVGDEDRESFELVAGAHAGASHTYPGCLRFSLGRDVLYTGRYQLVELWQTQAHFDAHIASDVFQTTQAALRDLATLQVQASRYEIA